MKYIETTADNLKRLAGIYNHYVRNTTVTFNTKEVDGSKFRETFMAEESRYILYAVEYEKKIIGFCSASPFNKKEAYRRSMYVSIYLSPESTGRGYGTRILEFIEKQAFDLGARSFIALISAENTTSCSFFEKHGYKKAGKLEKAGEKFGRLIDVVYYQKLADSL